MPHKIVLVILDGVGDLNRYASLSQLSPLGAAKTPGLDTIARDGVCGLMDPVVPGLACGSDTAHLSILGFPPHEYYTGRGALEALGAGLDVGVGDICFKCNFATLSEDGSDIVLLRRCDRRFEVEGPVLCAALDGLVIPGYPLHTLHVKYATEHRCGVSISGPGLSDQISGTDPLRDGRPLVVCSGDVVTSGVVNASHAAIRSILELHPINAERRAQGKTVANVVLLRGAGQRREGMPPFSVTPAFMVAPTCIISGLGKLLDMTIVIAPGASGDYHSDFKSKTETFLSALGGYAFGMLHVKAIDDSGHDGDEMLKRNLLEKCDADIVTALLSRLPVGTVLAITGDHSTPCSLGDHSADPVPFAAMHVQRRSPFARDCVFDELSCARGALGRFGGEGVMALLRAMALEE